MEAPYLLACDTTENWNKRSVILGKGELALEVAESDGGEPKVHLLLGNGTATAPNVQKLRARTGFIEGIPGAIAEAVLQEKLARETEEQKLSNAIHLLSPEGFEEFQEKLVELDEALIDEKQDRIQGDADTLLAVNEYINNEKQARIHGDIDSLQAAKEYTNEAQLATQTWLPAVPLKINLPVTNMSASINYLCRVISDTSINNGVYQAIAGWETEPVWNYFSDNADWVDDVELEAAIIIHGADNEAHVNKQNKITATGTTNLLTAPAAAGGQPGTIPVSELKRDTSFSYTLGTTNTGDWLQIATLSPQGATAYNVSALGLFQITVKNPQSGQSSQVNLLAGAASGTATATSFGNMKPELTILGQSSNTLIDSVRISGWITGSAPPLVTCALEIKPKTNIGSVHWNISISCIQTKGQAQEWTVNTIHTASISTGTLAELNLDKRGITAYNINPAQYTDIGNVVVQTPSSGMPTSIMTAILAFSRGTGFRIKISLGMGTATSATFDFTSQLLFDNFPGLREYLSSIFSGNITYDLGNGVLLNTDPNNSGSNTITVTYNSTKYQITSAAGLLIQL